MTQTISVMIVDDHLMVRDGLKVFLSIYDDIVVVGEAENGAEALAKYPQVEADVILMDLVMPVMDGLETIEKIRALSWPVKIIALTSFNEKDLVRSAIQAGADGFLHKDVHADKLVEAIRKAHQGQGTLDAAATQALINSTQEPAALGPDLTPREKEVLGLLVQGQTNREIGEALHISQGTVRLHVSNVLAKLNVSNRTEAVSVALQGNLLDLN